MRHVNICIRLTFHSMCMSIFLCNQQSLMTTYDWSTTTRHGFTIWRIHQRRPGVSDRLCPWNTFSMNAHAWKWIDGVKDAKAKSWNNYNTFSETSCFSHFLPGFCPKSHSSNQVSTFQPTHLVRPRMRCPVWWWVCVCQACHMDGQGFYKNATLAKGKEVQKVSEILSEKKPPRSRW